MNDSAVTADALAAWRDEQAVRDLVSLTAARLDRQDLDGWLELFDEDAEYEITAFSPEIRHTMTWWKSSRPELQKLIKEIPQHECDPARRLHLLGPVSVTLDGDRARAEVPFALYRTTPDGKTDLYVVGRYENSLAKKSGRWLYTAHHTLLETRFLDAFTHLPL